MKGEGWGVRGEQWMVMSGWGISVGCQGEVRGEE